MAKRFYLRAQDLYDLRELTGFISGEELHEVFRDLVGDPSPNGRRVIPKRKIKSHWVWPLIGAEVGDLSTFGESTKKYTGRPFRLEEDGWVAAKFFFFV
jgi:hypothetical protein